MDDFVRKYYAEHEPILRGSMENSGQEKDAMDTVISERFSACEDAWKNGYHEGRAQMREEAAKVCELSRPAGGGRWTAEQAACYSALSIASENIRALKT